MSSQSSALLDGLSVEQGHFGASVYHLSSVCLSVSLSLSLGVCACVPWSYLNSKTREDRQYGTGEEAAGRTRVMVFLSTEMDPRWHDGSPTFYQGSTFLLIITYGFSTDLRTPNSLWFWYILASFQFILYTSVICCLRGRGPNADLSAWLICMACLFMVDLAAFMLPI